MTFYYTILRLFMWPKKLFPLYYILSVMEAAFYFVCFFIYLYPIDMMTQWGFVVAFGRVPSGRRSRVSRRQIIQATWLGYNSSSSDDSMTTTDLVDDNHNNCGNQKPPYHPSTLTSQQPSSKSTGKPEDNLCEDVACGSSVLATTPITTAQQQNSLIGPNLVSSLEDFLEQDEENLEEEDTSSELLRTPIQLQLRSSPGTSLELSQGAQQPHAIFGRGSDHLLLDFNLEKDTLDSYISTMTDETDTNAYTFADPFDDAHSVASTNYESRLVILTNRLSVCVCKYIKKHA